MGYISSGSICHPGFGSVFFGVRMSIYLSFWLVYLSRWEGSGEGVERGQDGGTGIMSETEGRDVEKWMFEISISLAIITSVLSTVTDMDLPEKGKWPR